MTPEIPLARFFGPGALVVSLVALGLWASMVQAGPGALGSFEGHGDVGAPALTGSATWNAASQEYRLSGAGVNMWGPRDELQLVWKRLKGDFILRAHVEFLGEGVDPAPQGGGHRADEPRAGLPLRRRRDPRGRTDVAPVPPDAGGRRPRRSSRR